MFATRPRHQYPAHLRALVRTGQEHLIPGAVLGRIPRSCLSRWRKRSSPVRPCAADDGLRARTLALARLCQVLLRVAASARPARAVLRDALPAIAAAVEQERGTLGLREALRVFGIAPSTYHAWTRRRPRCGRSPLGRCTVRHPHQLRAAEVGLMRSLLSDPARAHWPICSIALEASRTGALHASLSTWYRYARALGLTRRPRRKPRYASGIRAKARDEIWHADVLVARVRDGSRHFVYLVQDNFSRRILAARVAPVLSGAIRMETLREAWAGVPTGRARRTMLITDGGPENRNASVDGFLEEVRPGLLRRIALKEVTASNAMVEAANKVLRYRYLDLDVADGAAVRCAVERFQQESNAVRPLVVLGGRTPDEVYFALRGPLDQLQALRAAQAERRAAHTGRSCCAATDGRAPGREDHAAGRSRGSP